ncbi:MAG: MFS transporter [Actinomycetota bacterium]
MSSSTHEGPSPIGSGTAAEPTAGPSRSAWIALAITGSAFFVVSLDITIVSLALPEIADDFSGTPLATLSWIATGYNIALAALFLVSGRIADVRGRRLTFVTGMAIFVATSALAGLAPNAGFLIAARVLQGAGGALLIPASLALVLPRFPPSHRSVAISLWGALGAGAAAFAPSLGAVLIDLAGWRAVFLVNLPIGVVVIALALRLVPESRDETATGRFDLVGVLTGTAGVALVVLSISRADVWGWGSTTVWASLAAGVVLVVVTVWRSAQHDSPLIDLGMFRIRSYAVAIALSVLFAVVFLAFWFVLPLFFRAAWGWSTLRTGFGLSPGPLLTALLAVPFGSRVDRIGHRRLLALGCVIAGSAFVWWTLTVDAEPAYWTAFFPGTILLGVGLGMAMPTSISAVLRDVPEAGFAAATAMRQTVFQIGGAIGIAVMVVLLPELGAPPQEVVDGYHMVWTLVAVLFVVIAALALLLYPPARPERDHAADAIEGGER